MDSSGKEETGNDPEVATVLVMDDEPIVLDSLAKAIEILGYRPLAAARGEDAVSLFVESLGRGIRVKAAILDLTIRNGMGGRDTLAELRQYDPDVRAIAASGYDANLANVTDYGFDEVIEKPFRIQDLAEVLDKVLGSA